MGIMMPIDWLIGLAGSGVIAGAAYLKRSLTASGALGAIALGTTMYALGSLAWFGTLIAFFVSSTLLTKLKQRRKSAAESGYAKSGNRDAGQVAANGGLALLLCIANAIAPHPLWWFAFVGSLAAVNADTWATEIGGLSRTAPISVVTGRRVAPGTSGGVTPLGLLASALGGVFVGAVAWALAQLGAPPVPAAPPGAAELAAAWLPLAAAGLAGGFVGSLADSLIGALWQTMYRCSVCGKEIERADHCGKPAVHIRGARWLNNDAVNVIASLSGAAAAIGIAFLFN